MKTIKYRINPLRLLGISLAIILSLAGLFSPPALGQNISKVELNNGLTALFIFSPGEELLSLEILIKTGAMQEQENLWGINNLINETLNQRVKEITANCFPDGLEGSGGLFKSYLYPDYLRLDFVIPPSYLPNLLDAIKTLVRDPAFTPELLAAKKAELQEQLKDQDGGFSSIYEIFLQNFYRYHPYQKSQLGYSTNMNNLTPEILTEFWRTNFVPNNMVFALAGQFNESEARKLLQRKFSDLVPVAKKKIEIPWEPVTQEKSIYLSARSNLAWFFLGFPAPNFKSNDYFTFQVIKSYLVDGLSSRLWLELREHRGLLYSLSGTTPELEGPAYFLINLTTYPKNIRLCRKLIFNIITELKNNGISSSELNAAYNKLWGGFLRENQTASSMAAHLGSLELYGLGYNYYLNYPKKYQRVTNEDIKRVARQYLEQYTLIVALPPGSVYFDF
jgi:zinc protease